MEGNVQNIVKEDESFGNEVQIVEFILGDEKFAVNLFDVREIVESFRITFLLLPGPYIKGYRSVSQTVIDPKFWENHLKDNFNWSFPTC